MSVINQVLRDLDARGAAVKLQPSKSWRQGPWHQAQIEHLFAEPASVTLQPRQTFIGRGDDPWRLPISGILVGVLGVMLVGGPWLSRLLEMGQAPSTAQLTPIDAARQKLPTIAVAPKSSTPTAHTAGPHLSTSAATPPIPATTAGSIEELPPPAAGPKSAIPRRSHATQTQTPTGTGTKLALQATVASAAGTQFTGHPSTAASPPAATPAMELASVEKKLSPMSPDQHAQALYAQAVESAQTGRSILALTQAQDALHHQPTHHLARHLAAMLLHETARTAQAIELLREGLKLDPQAQTLSFFLARLQAHQGALNAALETLDQSQLHSLEAESLRAGLWSQLHNYKQAAVAYEAALKLQPDQATLWLGLGVAFEGQAQSGPAQQAFTRAQALGLSDPELKAFVAQRLKALE